MPYKNDTRRTVTLNFPAHEYDSLAEDALDAGYATPGTYALAVVRARGEAPPPIYDQRSASRIYHLEGIQEQLLVQNETMQQQLLDAGIAPKRAEIQFKGYVPRSWAAQQREVERAVANALLQERRRVATQADNSAEDQPEEL